MQSRPVNSFDHASEGNHEFAEKLLSLAKDLLTLLKREHSALQARTNADLFEIAKQKQKQLYVLERHINQEKNLVAHLQAVTTRLKRSKGHLTPQPARVFAVWEEFCSVLHQCREQNNANGELIKILSCHTRGMLSLMQNTCLQNDIYDGTGKRRQTALSSYLQTA